MKNEIKLWRSIFCTILLVTVVARVGASEVGTFVLPLAASLGGSGVASPTAHTVPINEGASAQANTGVGTNGQLLIGSTGADPVWAALGVTGLTTITGNNSLTINNPGNISGSNSSVTQTVVSQAYTLSVPSPVGAATTAVTYGAGDSSGSDAAGTNVIIQPGAGTGSAQDQGSVLLCTPIFGASSSTPNAQNHRALFCGKTFAGSTTSASTDSFCTASLATSGTAATYYVWLHTEVKDASGTVNVDANTGVYQVTVKNNNGTLTVGTVTTITTGTAVNDSGALTIGALTATASGTTVTFKTAPSWTTIVASQVIIQYDFFTFGGPTTLSPQ